MGNNKTKLKIYESEFRGFINYLGKPSKKKNYVDRETVPISSDPPTIETVSEHLDRECW